MRKVGRGGVVKVSDLFQKYKDTLKAPEGTVIVSVIEVVHELLDITIKKEQLSYSPTTRMLSIQAPGPIRTELQLHKKEILNHLRGRLGEKSAPKDIL